MLAREWKFFCRSPIFWVVLIALFGLAAPAEDVLLPDGLIDQEIEGALGLPAIPATHRELYDSTRQSFRFCHHPNLAVYGGRLYAMWSNGISGEDENGQRVLMTSSADGKKWAETAVLVPDPDGEGPLNAVAAGFHVDGETIAAYYSAVMDRKSIYPGKSIVMLFRAVNSVPWLYSSTSSDHGESYTAPWRTNFPSATARMAVGNLPDGQAFVIWNPSQKQGRIPLVIALSRDSKTFDRAFVLRGEPTKQKLEGRAKSNGWQYPNALVWRDSLWVIYSVNKEDVVISEIQMKDFGRSGALFCWPSLERSEVKRCRTASFFPIRCSCGKATVSRCRSCT